MLVYTAALVKNGIIDATALLAIHKGEWGGEGGGQTLKIVIIIFSVRVVILKNERNFKKFNQ